MPHKIPPHALPVRNRNKMLFLLLAIAASTIVTYIFATILYFYQIPIVVILPTSAPVWVGFTTIGYMMQTEK